jgi:hypothetical protein
MQAPAWAVRLVGWRWMPSVALVSGSLAFVGIAVLVVPDDFGNVAGGSLQSSRSRSRLAENAGSTKDSSFELPSFKSLLPGQNDEESSPPTRQAASPVADENNVVQSIFHSAPTIELPVAPPDPNPEPPPPEPPPPPPTATIFTLPEPPPVPTPAPNTPPVAAPEAPGPIVPGAPTPITPGAPAIPPQPTQ